MSMDSRRYQMTIQREADSNLWPNSIITLFNQIEWLKCKETMSSHILIGFYYTKKGLKARWVFGYRIPLSLTAGIFGDIYINKLFPNEID